MKIPSGGAKGQSQRADGEQVTAARNKLSSVKFAPWRVLPSSSEGIAVGTAPPRAAPGSSLQTKGPCSTWHLLPHNPGHAFSSRGSWFLPQHHGGGGWKGLTWAPAA